MQAVVRELLEQQRSRQVALLSLSRRAWPRLSDALRAVTETAARALQVERASVWQFAPDRSRIVCQDLFRLSDGRHDGAGESLAARDFPTYFSALAENFTVAAHDARRDPRTCEFAQDYLEPNGITSMLDAPVWRDGEVVGIVCHEHTGPRREWTQAEQEFAGAIANQVSLAMERQDRRRASARRRGLDQVTPLLLEVIEQMPAGFVMVEARSRRVLLANRIAERMLGRPFEPHEVFGSGLVREIRVGSGAAREPQQGPLTRALELGVTTRAQEVSVLRHDGSWATLLVSATPVRDAHENIRAAVCIVDDVTERRLLEEEHQSSVYRERFISILGHDLRAPLSVISLSAQHLRRTTNDCPKHAAAAERIVAGCDRMERMIRDLLDFARSRGGGGIPITRQDTDLVAVCRSAVGDALAQAPDRKVEIEAKGACIGAWDPERLAQVVTNLVKNAAQHGDASAPIRLRVEARGGEALLEVHNRGPAIPAEDLGHVFEPFRSAGRSGGNGGGARSIGGNLGLGLYIASEIVRAHGGTIEVRSSAESGTTFAVRLFRGHGVGAHERA